MSARLYMGCKPHTAIHGKRDAVMTLGLLQVSYRKKQ